MSAVLLAVWTLVVSVGVAAPETPASGELVRLDGALTAAQKARDEGRLAPDEYEEFSSALRVELKTVYARVGPTPANAALHGRVLARLGDGRAALAALAEAQGRDPSSPAVGVALSQTHFEQGDYAAASAQANAVLEVDPTNAAAKALKRLSENRSPSSGSALQPPVAASAAPAPGASPQRTTAEVASNAAKSALANMPVPPRPDDPAVQDESEDGDRLPTKTIAAMALVSAGGFLLFGGLGAPQLESRLPNLRRNMGIAGAMAMVVASGAMLWEIGAARFAASALPIIGGNPKASGDVLSSGQRQAQRIMQSASNYAPQARVGLQRAATLEQAMATEFAALRTMGQPGSSARVRLLSGGVKEAQELFQRLSRFGSPVAGTSYPGRLVQLPNGARVGLRLASTSGPPTVDVHGFPGYAQAIEVKFIQ